MQTPRCPGQDIRYWKPEDIYEDKCPGCGNTLEFWKTDVRVRCEKCRRIVSNPRFDMGCAEWCSYAEQCLGEVSKGYGRPGSFLEKIKEAMKNNLENGDFEKLEETLSIAESLSEKRGAELIVVVTAACLRTIRNTFEEKESLKAAEKFIQQVDPPRLALEEAYQVVGELEKGEAKSLNARMLYKSIKLQGLKKEGRE